MSYGREDSWGDWKAKLNLLWDVKEVGLDKVRPEGPANYEQGNSMGMVVLWCYCSGSGMRNRWEWLQEAGLKVIHILYPLCKAAELLLWRCHLGQVLPLSVQPVLWKKPQLV